MIINTDLQITEELNTGFEQNDNDDIGLDIGTIMEGIDPDYEKMRNLPQINGNTLIGNKTTAQLGIGIVGTYANENLNISLI